MPDVLLRPWRHLFDFQGRSTRTEYWLFMLQIAAIAMVLVMLLVMLAGSLGEGIGAASLLVIIPFAFFAFIAGLSAAVRRLHDQDLSGWFYLINLIPYLGGFIFLIMMLLPGTDGENRFGPNPRDPEQRGTDEVAGIFS
ncbi:DUF805 domain-containing protein [Sphingomonas parva]|uniref:DUF805 domain-containing protein n=1 Tax=Sphingomonas parva TaxID=2555898 RepID=A0A4Y8ZKK4_9SPHN|nr:DUF805 domain-containing protein [Sphingomonas parva]TFI56518.1 DUF805 domain-containing protein [Sphingomonas parva]